MYHPNFGGNAGGFGASSAQVRRREDDELDDAASCSTPSLAWLAPPTQLKLGLTTSSA